MDPVWPLLVLAALLVAVGIAGTVLPALPGALLVLIGLGVAAWAEDFAFVGTGSLVAIGGEQERWTVLAFYPKALTPG